MISYTRINVFIWLSFIYHLCVVAKPGIRGYLSKGSTNHFEEELRRLPHQRQLSLLQEFEQQRREVQNLRFRDSSTDFVPTDIDDVMNNIQYGYTPVVRDKRALQFLITSLSNILGFGSQITGVQAIPTLANGIMDRMDALLPPVMPKAPVAPKKPMPPMNGTQPGMKPLFTPNPPVPALPTIPTDQINPNTIRYPFIPAQNIPFLSFSALPAGVIVPYPSLLEWPAIQPKTPATPSSSSMPPCSSPPLPGTPMMAKPKNPAKMPAPKSKDPITPTMKLPKSPESKITSIDDDLPFRIDILNSGKPHLPMSGSTFSGNPPNNVEEHTDKPWLEMTTTSGQNSLDSYHRSGYLEDSPKFSAFTHDVDDNDYDSFGREYGRFQGDDSYFDKKERKITKETPQKYPGFVSNFDIDYPVSSNENEDVIDKYNDRPSRNLNDSEVVDKKVMRKSKNTKKGYVKSIKKNGSLKKTFSPLKSGRPSEYFVKVTNTQPTKTDLKYFPWNETGTLDHYMNKNRNKRDLFFDDAFKHFNLSALDYLQEEPFPISTHSQFLDFHEPEVILTPEQLHRANLEKDLERYVESYVEGQINNGAIDTKKPKTTVVELKTKAGPPIKTVTTTVSKLIDGNKKLTDAILEFSKNINPVSNIGEFVGEGDPEPVQAPEEQSPVKRAFLGANDDFDFGW